MKKDELDNLRKMYTRMAEDTPSLFPVPIPEGDTEFEQWLYDRDEASDPGCIGCNLCC